MNQHAKNILKTTAAIAAAGAMGAAPAHAEYLGGFGGLDQIKSANSVAVGPDGRVYVSDATANTVRVFDSVGTPDRTFGSFSGAGGIAVNDMFVYVVERDGARVARFTRDGNPLGTFGSKGVADGQFVTPEDVAARGDKVVVTSGNRTVDATNRFTRFDKYGKYTAGNARGGDGQAKGQFSRITAVALDRNGKIYTTETGNDRVQKFGEDFSFDRMWGSTGSGIGKFIAPTGITADDSLDSVWVADLGNGSVQRFSTEGVFQESLPSGILKTPTDVAVDCRGTVYVTDVTKGRVEKFGSKPAVVADNLLANPGFEQGGASCSSERAAAGAGPGWGKSPAATAVHYGGAGGFPGRFDGDKLGGGESFLAGGPNNAQSQVEQTIDVSKQAIDIDDGRRLAKLQGLLGGILNQDDVATVTATFQDGAGKAVGSLKLGPVTAADRKNLTALLPRDASATVPKGTRSINVTVTMTRAANGGVYNDAYVDQLGLTLTAQRPGEKPGTGNGVDTTAPQVAVRLIKRSGRKITLGVGCDEACSLTVGGKLLGVKLASVSRPRAAGERRLALRLTKATARKLQSKLRNHAVKLAVTVKAADAAGNAATAKRTLKITR